MNTSSNLHAYMWGAWRLEDDISVVNAVLGSEVFNFRVLVINNLKATFAICFFALHILNFYILFLDGKV